MRVDLFVSSWLFSQFLFIVRSSGETVHNTLKCYQCEFEGKDPNHLCEEEYLKVCPNDYAADRCLTHIKRNLTGHYLISKRCALAPCELPGIQSSLLKLASSCDQSRDEFSCYTCCDFDGCNLHSSSVGIHQRGWGPLAPSSITFLSLAILTLVLSFQSPSAQSLSLSPPQLSSQ